jgi:hypothetical protein
MNRGVTLIALTLLTGALGSGGNIGAQAQPVVEVYKSPTCGCCANWVEHLKKAGFTVHATNVDDMTKLKASHNVPRSVQSCHTAVVDGYVIEGHVPAADVQRLLRERPAVAGIAVPGMPIGSPGMEVEGRKPDAYDVVTFDKQGQTKVFSSYNK